MLCFTVGCKKKKVVPTLELRDQSIQLYVGDTYEIKPIVGNIENPEFVY